jgi:hypothetical protein
MPQQPELLQKLLEAWFELDECEPADRPKLMAAFDTLVAEAMALDATVSRHDLMAALKDRYKKYRASRFSKAAKVGLAP